MKHNLTMAGLFTVILFSVYGCSTTEQQNMLSDQEKKDGWALLFDGKTMNGWHLFNKGTIPSAWYVDSGRLICNPHAKDVKHGDLVTDNVYQDFDLRFEWKISRAGNSGLFINVQERPELMTTFSTGPEYQLLDDKNVEPDYLKNPTHKAAAIFGVVPNNSSSMPKPGEWNQSRILQQNGKVTCWLNDVQTVQVDLQSAEWKNLVALSSLSKYPEFAVAVSGHLAVQDWTNGVAFRNIKIKELSKAQQPAESENIERTMPGAEKLEFTDTIELQANENMRFDKEMFKIRTGKKIRLIFKNTGAPSNMAMAHNVVILQKGTDIADFADAVHNAKNEQYVPSSVGSFMIAHTKLVSGGDSDEVDFTISQPGIYDYICSFPGHWGTMQGKIVAE
ncbi:MAG TPA: family 16 glycoside hydrolase [Puia sp.]|nr:family 16 glycoside hydrolase [Puia sp.]